MTNPNLTFLSSNPSKRSARVSRSLRSLLVALMSLGVLSSMVACSIADTTTRLREAITDTIHHECMCDVELGEYATIDACELDYDSPTTDYYQCFRTVYDNLDEASQASVDCVVDGLDTYATCLVRLQCDAVRGAQGERCDEQLDAHRERCAVTETVENLLQRCAE